MKYEAFLKSDARTDTGTIGFLRTIFVGPSFFEGAANIPQQTQKRAAILFHEITHLMADTEDYGYVLEHNYMKDPVYVIPKTFGAELPTKITLTPDLLQMNGDTYGAFLYRYFM